VFVKVGLEDGDGEDAITLRRGCPVTLGRGGNKGGELLLGFVFISCAKALAADSASSVVIPAGVPGSAVLWMGLVEIVVADLESLGEAWHGILKYVLSR
jgi:hypothetical protein